MSKLFSPWFAFYRPGLNWIVPADCVDEDIFKMTPGEKDVVNIDSLPSNLKVALDVWEEDPIVKDALEEHILEKYIEGKELEGDVYRMAVIDWEIQNCKKIIHWNSLSYISCPPKPAENFCGIILISFLDFAPPLVHIYGDGQQLTSFGKMNAI